MRVFDKTTRVLQLPLGTAPRAALLLSAVLTASIYLFPLWTLTMFAPQYQEGLRLEIYSYKLEGGNHGQDLREINVLNHYIGMRDLAEQDFTEFKWLPFVAGALGLLFLRAAIHGTVGHLVDVLVMYFYFGAFALWSFAFKMYSYGHSLSPSAAVQVPPFMPPLFGYKQLANFEVYSYPQLATYALALVGALLLVALGLAWRSQRARPVVT
jgi:copper chaperone NosL